MKRCVWLYTACILRFIPIEIPDECFVNIWEQLVDVLDKALLSKRYVDFYVAIVKEKS